MSKWRVYNKHPNGLTHKEKFRDEMIVIKANEFVLMDYEDAVLFKGQYFPMRMQGDNQQDPTSFKCITIEKDPSAVTGEEKTIIKYVCHLDGKEFASKAELESYVNSAYGDVEPYRDESIEAEIQTQPAEDVPKRGRGRPPRDKTL